jgi:WD40 repeat protein
MTITIKTAHEIKFSPPGDCVAFIGGRNVTVIDLTTGKQVFEVHHTAHPSSIDYSPDGSLLVVKSTSGRTKVLDAANGDILIDFKNQKEGEGESAFFSSCGKYVVSASWSGSLTVRNAATGKITYVKNYPRQKLGDLTTTSDRSTFIYSVCRPPISPTNLMSVEKHLLPPSEEDGQLPLEWPFINSLQLSPSGKYLSVIYDTPDHKHEIYELKTMRLLFKQPIKYGGSGISVAWSDDESFLSYCGDNEILVLEFPEMSLLHQIPMQYPCFTGFSPSATHIALGSWSKSFVVPVSELASFEAQKKKTWKPKKPQSMDEFLTDVKGRIEKNKVVAPTTDS